MSSIQLPDPTSWAGALLLSDLGVIQAEGPDAASFLHGQISQDANGQRTDEGRLAAYCSAKGRMLGSLLNLRPQTERFWLLTDAQVLPGLLKRLNMFVLRAKAKLTDASGHIAVLGFVGGAAFAKLEGVAPDLKAWQAAPFKDGLVLALPDVLGVRRGLFVGPSADAQALLATLPALDAAAWRWLDVMSGIPRIESATVDQFVPQMINFELIGGVNFQKGCYPGQEVVARSQYRGTAKRRVFIVHAAQAVRAGQEVFSAADPGQPAGMVVNAASVGDLHSALVELKLNALGTALRAGAPDGPTMTLGELPYALPSSEEAA